MTDQISTQMAETNQMTPEQLDALLRSASTDASTKTVEDVGEETPETVLN